MRHSDHFNWPDLRNGPESIIWAARAPAGQVADVRAHALAVLERMEKVQTQRADEVCAQVPAELGEEAIQ